MTHISDVSRPVAQHLSPADGIRAASQNTSDSSSGSAAVTANDFLTLLVTEMKNQDPTTQTDPTQYINQLVQVNSLQQLISINQTLSNSLGSTSGSSPNSHAEPVSQPPVSEALDTRGASTLPSRSHAVPGNLGIPRYSSASQKVANALGRHS